jgi:predicted MFS family arabinose efflux permease
MSDVASPVPTAREPYRWYVLALLTLVYSFNIADRYIVSTVLEPIRLELQLSDSAIAFLTGVALALFYVTVGLPIATFDDRANRRNIIVVAVAVWSAMTALCGFAQNFWQLLLARFGVGVGEAGGTPPSTSILADTFAPRQRPMALTVFALGAPFGAWLGSQLAGLVADRWTWRAAFIALGVPGFLLALVVALTLREPRRGRFEGNIARISQANLSATLSWMFKHRSALHIILGGTIATLWGWGLVWWTPAFLARVYGLSSGQSGTLLGPMHLVGGTVATLITGWLVARPFADDSRRIAWLLAGVVLLATIPSTIAYYTNDRGVAVTCLWIVIPAIYFFIGPTLGMLQNVFPPEMRAQAVAVLLFAANVANLIIAPQLVGFSSDYLAPTLGGHGESLRRALIVLSVTGAWGAWHFYRSARTLREDEASTRAVTA